VQRIPFLKSFSADTRAKVAWLEAEFSRLETQLPEHRLLIEQLRVVLAEARAKLSDLDLIIGIAHPNLMQFAMPIVHSLEYLAELVGTTYLPVLQRQGEGERFVRGLLFAAARAAGMDWLRDVAVRLDGPHAAIVSLSDLPIVYAPPRHQVALADMPGLYHELGHATFTRDQQIGAALSDAVRTHFVRHRRQAGTLPPGKRSSRAGLIDDAEAYWTHERLAEVFCDVLATVVCGPAHYVSFVDLGLRHHRGPYELVPDAHPPMCARVHACYAAVSLPHRQEPLVKLVRDAWTTHQAMHPCGHEYTVTCSDDLLDELARVARGEITRVLPTLRPFSGPLPSRELLLHVAEDASLESILNQAAAVLFLEPDAYAAWEPAAIDRCKRISEEELARRSAAAPPSHGASSLSSGDSSSGIHRIVRV
jgi:hypothetical protein